MFNPFNPFSPAKAARTFAKDIPVWLLVCSYSFITRGWWRTVTIGSLLSCAIFVIGLIAATAQYLDDRKLPEGERFKAQFIALFAIVGLPFYGIYLYTLAVIFKDIGMWIFSLSSLTQKLLFGPPFILLASGTLFYVRLFYRSLYGASEACVGLAIGTYHLVSINELAAKPPIETMFAVLTASIYLVVRGFDNIHQGLTKDPKDQKAIALLESLKSKLQ